MKSLKSLLMKVPYGKFPFERYSLVIALLILLAIIPLVFSSGRRMVSEILASSAPTPSNLRVSSQTCQSNNEKVDVTFDWDGSTGSNYLYQVLVRSSSYQGGDWREASGTSATSWSWVGLPHNSNFEWKVRGIYVPDWSTVETDKKSFTTKNCAPDSDGDGIPDSSDSCPSEAGYQDNDGCPDEEPVQPAASCSGNFGENEYKVCYFGGTNFSGLIQESSESGGPQIWHEWLGGEVLPGRKDNLSGKWRGYFTFNQSKYEIQCYADDGLKVIINDNVVFDNFASDGSKFTAFCPTGSDRLPKIDLAGRTKIEIWWNEKDGDALLKLNFVKASGCSRPAWDGVTEVNYEIEPIINYMKCYSSGEEERDYPVWGIMVGLFGAESTWGTDTGPSLTNDYGILQFNTDTWPETPPAKAGESLWNPGAQVEAGEWEVYDQHLPTKWSTFNNGSWYYFYEGYLNGYYKNLSQ